MWAKENEILSIKFIRTTCNETFDLDLIPTLLQEPFDLDRFVQPICLENNEDDEDESEDEDCFTAGWTDAETGGQWSVLS